MNIKFSCFFVFLFISVSLASCSNSLFKAHRIDGSYMEPKEGMFYALPKGYIPIEIERKISGNKTTLAVTVNEPKFSPDINQIYRLKYKSSSTSSDAVLIEVDKNGLLKTVTTTTTDPIPVAIREFSNFVIGVTTSGITSGPSLVARDATTPTAADVDKSPFKVSAIVDPSQKGAQDTDYQNLKDFLEEFGVSIKIEGPAAVVSPNDDDSAIEMCQVMICHRYVMPYKITVTDAKVSKSQASALVLLPNEGPIAGINVVRRGLVENKFNLVFSNGILTKAEYTDPSVVIAAINIPIDVLKAVVSIPSAIFQFKITSQSNLAEIKAQTELLEVQEAHAAAQIKLQQTLAAPAD